MRELMAGALALAALAPPIRAQCPDGTPPPCRQGSPARSAAPRPTSVAVLDFENLSRDTADAYLVEGLAEELTARLGGVGRLSVTSRAVVRRLQARATMSIPDIGRALNVMFLVNGSVRRSGSRLRVSAELLRAGTGVQEWSAQYDRTETDLLAIQEAVATAVATAVAGRLLPAERRALAARPTNSGEAYDAYLRGRAASRRANTLAQYTAAASLLERAVSLDSGFAVAWSWLSQTHSFAYWSYVDRSESRLALARAAAERTLAVAPGAAASHVAMGYYHYWGRRDYDRAMAEFSAALAIQPNDWESHAAVANVARRQGRWEASLASRARALELDSGNAFETAEQANTLLKLRRFAEAEQHADRALALDPDYLWSRLLRMAMDLARDGEVASARSDIPLITARVQEAVAGTRLGYIALWRTQPALGDAVLRGTPEPTREGRAGHWMITAEVRQARGERDHAARAWDSLRVIVEELLQHRPDDALFRALLGLAYAGLGRRDEAVRQAERAVELLPVARDALDGPDYVYLLAEVLIMVGEHDRAIERLEYLLGIPITLTRAMLRADPLYAPLRGNPRFERLVAGN